MRIDAWKERRLHKRLKTRPALITSRGFCFTGLEQMIFEEENPMQISRGDVGSHVGLIQNRLNRLGALLVEDGHFGGGTVSAVNYACEQLDLPVVSEVDAMLWEKLNAVKEPSSLLPTRGVTFIAIEEITSRRRYDQAYIHPCWPGEYSGITIGIGYDLRFADKAKFDADWRHWLTKDSYEVLLPWLLKQGSKDGADSLKNTTQPFIAAWNVFTSRTIPLFVHETQKAFPGYDDLPPLCQSALVSLVYNRGAGMNGDRRVEMLTIRSMVADGKLSDVPSQFEAMKRLWPNTSGLCGRRDREANLWRDGLAKEVVLS
ncbi:MAG: hypothetical protein HQL93_09675 [Magnetococcales bacterium]|nr:hypothetical protein [Magnetococcales bacterium]